LPSNGPKAFFAGYLRKEDSVSARSSPYFLSRFATRRSTIAPSGRKAQKPFYGKIEVALSNNQQPPCHYLLDDYPVRQENDEEQLPQVVL
jgi:hypothetical protein